MLCKNDLSDTSVRTQRPYPWIRRVFERVLGFNEEAAKEEEPIHVTLEQGELTCLMFNPRVSYLSHFDIKWLIFQAMLNMLNSWQSAVVTTSLIGIYQITL